MDKKFQLEEQTMRKIIEQLRAPVALINKEGVLLWCNSVWQQFVDVPSLTECCGIERLMRHIELVSKGAEVCPLVANERIWKFTISQCHEQLLLVQAEKYSNELHEKWSSISDILQKTTNIAMFTTNKHGLITMFNKGAERLLGYDAKEIVHNATPLLFHDIDEVHERMQDQEQYDGNGFEFLVHEHRRYQQQEWTYIGKDGRAITAELSLYPVDDEYDTELGYLAIVLDISQQKQTQEELNLVQEQMKMLSLIDPLTGLANRNFFMKALEEEWQRGLYTHLPLSVIAFEIDHFSEYYWQAGEDKANELIRQIALAAKDTTMRSTDIIARLNREEFAVILPNTPQSGARVVAEKIRQAIVKMQIVHPDLVVGPYVTISLGVHTIVPNEHAQQEQLVRQAGQALQRAKQYGGNGYQMSGS